MRRESLGAGRILVEQRKANSESCLERPGLLSEHDQEAVDMLRWILDGGHEVNLAYCESIAAGSDRARPRSDELQRRDVVDDERMALAANVMDPGDCL